ncbi:MAG: hypothetical protein OEZ13_11060 [Spirochaetia bacterium]|nr:hypothetical protein [Spirochaetia bacterium]
MGNNESLNISAHKSGKLKRVADKLWSVYEKCNLCPHVCGVNRFKGEKGFCQSVAELIISSAYSHYGEESALSERQGSGTKICFFKV